MLPILLVMWTGVGCAGGANMESARADVLAAEEAMNVAVDGLDCAGGMVAMRESEPLFVSNATVVRTKSELAAMCEQMVAPRTGAVFAADARTANMMSEDSAVVVREGTYTISFKDGTSQAMHMVMTTVWAREGGGWQMVHLHESFQPLADQ
jgi:ketosteroid isomerase-like protein